MIFLQLTSVAVRHFARLLPRLFRSCQVLLAVVILAVPCASLLECPEVESSESSVPIEDDSEYLATNRRAPARRALKRTTDAFVLKRLTDVRARFQASYLQPGRFVSGHCLANGFRAPLRC